MCIIISCHPTNRSLLFLKSGVKLMESYQDIARRNIFFLSSVSVLVLFFFNCYCCSCFCL